MQSTIQLWQLSTQTQSFPIINGNVCFRQKPPFRFRDYASAPLMTATGWKTDMP